MKIALSTTARRPQGALSWFVPGCGDMGALYRGRRTAHASAGESDLCAPLPRGIGSICRAWRHPW